MSSAIYARYMKRCLDIVIPLAVLILFWWVYVLLAVLVRLNLGTPVIFTQERPGKDGKIFYKKVPAFSLTGPGPGARMESRMDKEAGK